MMHLVASCILPANEEDDSYTRLSSDRIALCAARALLVRLLHLIFLSNMLKPNFSAYKFRSTSLYPLLFGNNNTF